MSERKSAVAWAVASMVNPRPAYLGVSASAWIISYDDWKTITGPECIASKEANRHQWYANIKAAVGVLERVDEAADVCIYTPEETIANLFATMWRRSNGSEGVAFDAAQDLYRLAAAKGLSVRLVYQAPDKRAKDLTAFAKARAEARYNELPDAELAAAPLAPNARQKRSKAFSFPAVKKGFPEVGDF